MFELESFDEHSNETFDSMRLGCALYSASFSIFKDYVLRKLDEANTHSPAMSRKQGCHLVGDQQLRVIVYRNSAINGS